MTRVTEGEDPPAAVTRQVTIATDADLPTARATVRSTLAGRPGDLVDAAELVTSELVTNALLHGGGVASVTVSVEGPTVRVKVADRNRQVPVPAAGSPDAMTGRGLSLVSSLAARWGVTPDSDGKTVWAELEPGPARADDRAAQDILDAWADPFDDADSSPTVRVELGDVPTDLLVAAKRHVDNLVREFALAARGERSGTTAPVPAPLAELIERIVDRFEAARLEMKRQAHSALGRGSPRTNLVLHLDIGSVDAAEEYLRALDEIDAYCRANRLLTLETPPQHRVFRQWYIGEVTKQLRAAAAGGDPVPSVSFEQRLLQEVDAAENARRAADRAARLYTVAVALASATEAESVAAAVLDEGVAALGASAGGVLLATDADHLAVPATVGYDEPTVAKLRTESPDADLPAAYALRTGESVWLETVEERDARFPALVGLEPSTVAMCAVPVAARGELLGALRFSFSERRLFDADEQRFVLALAAEAAEALQRSRLLEQERDARRRLEKLAAVGEEMLRGGTIDRVLQLAIDAATEISGAEVGLLTYTGPPPDGGTSPQLTLVSVTADDLRGTAAPQGEMADAAAHHPSPQLVRSDDVTTDKQFPVTPLATTALGPALRSMLSVPVRLPNGDVAGAMVFGHRRAAKFDSGVEHLVMGVAGQTAAVVENVLSLAERTRIAEAMKDSLVPSALPIVDGIELGAGYVTAAQGVGGDFYDVFALPSGALGLAIGDVRGRGPRAAALTSLARYTIRTAALLGQEPADVMAVLNGAMRSDDDPERFCSAVYLRLTISPDGPQISAASAGHPPLAIIREDRIEMVHPTGPLAGVSADAVFGDITIVLGGDDTLVLYTDGISEARDADGVEFGETAIQPVLESMRGRSAEAVAADLLRAAQRFADEVAADDAAVLVIKPATT